MDRSTHPKEINIENTNEFLSANRYKIAIPFIILKSIKYNIGLKYPEYLPYLNRLNVNLI